MHEGRARLAAVMVVMEEEKKGDERQKVTVEKGRVCWLAGPSLSPLWPLTTHCSGDLSQDRRT